MRIDSSVPCGWQICRRAQFHNDRGTGDAIAGLEARTIVQRAAPPVAFLKYAMSRNARL